MHNSLNNISGAYKKICDLTPGDLFVYEETVFLILRVQDNKILYHSSIFYNGPIEEFELGDPEETLYLEHYVSLD
jgi:hypothetical protein